MLIKQAKDKGLNLSAAIARARVPGAARSSRCAARRRQLAAAAAGSTTFTQMPAPSSIEAATVSRATARCASGTSHPGRSLVQQGVPGQIRAQQPAQPRDRIGQCAARGRVQRRVWSVVYRRDPGLERHARERRAEDDQTVLLVHGCSRQRAQRAAGSERGSLLHDPRRRIGERHQLRVRVVERCAGRGALVDRCQHVARAAREQRGSAADARPPSPSPSPPGAGRPARSRDAARAPPPRGRGRPGTCSAPLARSSPGCPPARRPAGRRPAISGGVIASWPSQNGQCSASPTRVVRPVAPGREARPGTTSTVSPVSGCVRRSSAIPSAPRSPSVAGTAAAGRSAPGRWWCCCWCLRSRSASAGSAASARSGAH